MVAVFPLCQARHARPCAAELVEPSAKRLRGESAALGVAAVSSEIAQIVEKEATAPRPLAASFDISQYTFELFLKQAAEVGKVTANRGISSTNVAFAEQPFETSRDTLVVIAAAATFMNAFEKIGLTWAKIEAEPNKLYEVEAACSKLGLRAKRQRRVWGEVLLWVARQYALKYARTEAFRAQCEEPMLG
jgi:hypothetical protein